MTIKTVRVTSNLIESNRLKTQVAQRTSDTTVPLAQNFDYNWESWNELQSHIEGA